MPNSPYTAEQRKALLIKAGEAAEFALRKSEHPPRFLPDSTHLDRVLRDYLQLRSQYAVQHHIRDGLLANHKVAALYVFVLTREPPTNFFLFPAGTPSQVRRVALAVMMYTIVISVLFIEGPDINQQEYEDLEYCLLKEDPSNLEWLCFAMHALCRHYGKATNLAV